MATSPDTVLIGHIETQLECSFCLETLDDPRTLQCFHSFCKDCLEEYVKGLRQQAAGKNIDQFSCPTCRSPFTLKSQEQVAGLPSNYFIRNMLDVTRLQQKAKLSKCSVCQEPAVCRCLTCEMFMCEQCRKAHEVWPSNKKHTVMSTEELAEPENFAKLRPKVHCQKHEGKTIKFYCKTCEQLLCRYCMDFDHVRPDHVCCQVKDVAQEHSEELGRRCRSLEECLKEGSEALKSVRNTKQSLEDDAKKAKEQIARNKEETLKTFMQKLEEKVEDLMNEVDKKYHETMEPLLKQELALKDYVDKAKRSLDLTKNLQEKGNDMEIISSHKIMKDNEQKLKVERPQNMEPGHNGKMRYESCPLDVNDVERLLKNLGKIACNPERSQLCYPSVILNGDLQYMYCLQMRDWLGDQFQWRLCYRATRDGWSAGDFHRCCDNKGPTVVLVKVGEYIFGGYTDQSWGGQGYKNSDASFLFSLKNKDNLPAFKAVIHPNKDNAIYSHPSFGPVFGGGHDLYIVDNADSNQYSSTNFGWSYSLPPGYHYDTAQAVCLLAGINFFTPTELEVFY